MTRLWTENPQFYLTAPAPCPYLSDRLERKVFTHLVGERATALNDVLTQGGFRRSQNIAYRPACEGCRACISVRVAVDDFIWSKAFRRILKANADVDSIEGDTSPSSEQYALFRAYLDARHHDGGMADMSVLDYAMMVEDTHVDTVLIEYRAPDGDAPRSAGAPSLAAADRGDGEGGGTGTGTGTGFREGASPPARPRERRHGPRPAAVRRQAMRRGRRDLQSWLDELAEGGGATAAGGPVRATDGSAREGKLVACALTDVLGDGLSMVYSFFDPDESARSLGTFMILDHVMRAQRLGLPYVYLGYWVEGSPKMDYKRRFQPQEHLGPHGWRRV